MAFHDPSIYEIERAVSVREPWAWLLASGQKLAEIRSWKPKIKLPAWVALHASQTNELNDSEFMEDFYTLRPDMWDLLDDPVFANPNARVFGVGEIVGAIKIVDSIFFPVTEEEPDENGEIHNEHTAAMAKAFADVVNGNPRMLDDIPVGNWVIPGMHHWIIGDSVRFKTTIVYRGSLQIWKMPDHLRKAVIESIDEGELKIIEPFERQRSLSGTW